MSTSVFLIALLLVGSAHAQPPQTPPGGQLADAEGVAAAEALVGEMTASASCGRGKRHVRSGWEKTYAAEVCIGEWQKYAHEQACDAFPQMIENSGLRYYKTKIKPHCTDGKGKYWCNIVTNNPCWNNMRNAGSMSTATVLPKGCKKTFPSPSKKEVVEYNPGTLLCPAGYRKAPKSVVFTFLERWLADSARGKQYVPAGTWCSKIGFKWIAVKHGAGCIGPKGSGLVVQGEVSWVCEQQARIRRLPVRVIDPWATMVCPWRTKIELDLLK